jgi:hypothetical protein
MKQALLVCLLCLLILFACDNPMKIGLPHIANTIGTVLFNSVLYKTGDTDFSPGYANGMIRSDQISPKVVSTSLLTTFDCLSFISA